MNHVDLVSGPLHISISWCRAMDLVDQQLNQTEKSSTYSANVFFHSESCPSYQAKLVDLWTFRITHNPRNTLCSINNPPLCTLTQANLSHSSFLPSHSHSHLAHVLKLESSPFHFPRHPHIVHRQHGSSPPSAPPNLLLHPKCPHDSACAKWPCAPLVVGRLFWHHGWPGGRGHLGGENDRSLVKHTGEILFWGGDEDLVVGRTTHLRHMLVKMGSSSPNIRGEHKKSVSNHQRVQMVLKGRKGFRPFLGLPWHPNSLHIGAVDHQVENPIALKPWRWWFDTKKSSEPMKMTGESEQIHETPEKNPSLSRNKKHGG